MKYYEVGFDAGVCYSCNIIQGETEAACRYAAEAHAKKYGYKVGYFEEIAESALEYNRKPVWNADRYQQPETDPEQPKTETAEADETETETNEQEGTKMFENIIKAIAEAAREQSAKFFAHMETCTTIGALRNDSYVRQYTTPKQLERLLAMDDSEAIPNKDYVKIMNKYTATIQKRQKATIDKLYAAEAAEMPQNIALHITWTRNNTWGWNPHVECTVDYKTSTYGTASGCGYDKTSAAAAEALNASTAILKALYTWVNEGGYTYGVNTPDRLHWISAPYFEGGCGMSTIRAAFEAMGYKCEDRTHYNRRGTEESRNVYFYKD